MQTGSVADDEKFPTDANEYITYGPEIGRGAFAEVYRGRIKATGRDVAIKVLKLTQDFKDTLDDIRKEIAVMSQMRHKNLVPIRACFVWGEDLWIVMPLLLGSCHAILKNQYPKGIKDEALLATLIREVLEGLKYTHADKLIHRDIKAGNILISKTGDVMLADFGVAGALQEGGETNKRRTFAGTPCWMAPEVMEQAASYDCKADIWSTGITALELAMGSAPYAHFQPMKVLLLTLREKPPSFDSYPDKSSKWSKDFVKFIDACLKKDPKDRPSAEKLLKHSWFKKAKDLKYVEEKISVPQCRLIVGTKMHEINLGEFTPKLVEGEDSTNSGYWTFSTDDLTAVKEGVKDTLEPVEKPKSHSKGSVSTGAEEANIAAAAAEANNDNKDDNDPDDEAEEMPGNKCGRFEITNENEDEDE